MKELEHPDRSVPKGRRFCTICGEIKRETHFEGDSTHCDTCCEKMRHTHVRVYGVLVFVLLLALSAGAALLGVQTVQFCRSTRSADTLAEDRYLNDACDAYETAFAEIPAINRKLLLRGSADEESADGESAEVFSLFEAGVHTWARYAAVYARTHSDYEASSMLQGQLSADAIAKSTVLSAYSEAQTAYEAVSGVMQDYTDEHPFDTIEDMPYEEIIALLDKIEQENDSRYYKGYAELFKGSATQYYKTDDPTSSFVYYDKALEYIPDESANIYSSEADAAKSAQDWTALRQAGEAITLQNRNYTEAYEWVAVAAAKQGDAAAAKQAAEDLRASSPDSPLYEKLLVQSSLICGDLQAAQKVIDGAKSLDKEASSLFSKLLAEQTLPSASQRFLREYAQFASYAAVVSLLQGDKGAVSDYGYERSFNYAYYLEYLTGSSAITQQIFDVALICASVIKNDEALNTLSQMGACSEDAQKVIDGKLTPEQAFLKGEADLL